MNGNRIIALEDMRILIWVISLVVTRNLNDLLSKCIKVVSLSK